MTHGEPGRTAVRSPALPPAATGITIYGCEPAEAVLFRELAPRFGVVPTIIDDAVTEATSALALGNRCVSVGHKPRITGPTLLALSEAVVEYLSTRNIGFAHIDVDYALRVCIFV